MRRSCTVEDAAAVAAEVRALAPAGESVADAVREIVEEVRARGDAAVSEYELRFGDGEWGRVPPGRLATALAELDPAVRAGLEVAIANVEAVAAAGLDAESLAVLPQGQSVRLREVPVARAAVYAPGGRAP
jgi:histidinol dehydrogenase